jgi:hypothetical protein
VASWRYNATALSRTLGEKGSFTSGSCSLSPHPAPHERPHEPSVCGSHRRRCGKGRWGPPSVTYEAGVKGRQRVVRIAQLRQRQRQLLMRTRRQLWCPAGTRAGRVHQNATRQCARAHRDGCDLGSKRAHGLLRRTPSGVCAKGEGGQRSLESESHRLRVLGGQLSPQMPPTCACQRPYPSGSRLALSACSYVCVRSCLGVCPSLSLSVCAGAHLGDQGAYERCFWLVQQGNQLQGTQARVHPGQPAFFPFVWPRL